MTALAKRQWTEFAQLRTWPFIGVHLVAISGVIYSGWSWNGFALAIGLYYARMFFVTAGYHRYFSHRSFKTSRFFQFILALGGSFSIQKGALWWAANHRHHHRSSDQGRHSLSSCQWILVVSHRLGFSRGLSEHPLG